MDNDDDVGWRKKSVEDDDDDDVAKKSDEDDDDDVAKKVTKSNWSKDKNQCLDKISHLLETVVKVHFLGDECLNVHC